MWSHSDAPPPTATIIPSPARTMKKRDSAATPSASAFSAYFSHSIPEEIYESARIDGASEFVIFFKLVLPLSVPILATVGLMSGIAYWNDWQNALYYIDDKSLYTVQAVLNAINESVAMLASLGGTAGASAADLPSTTIRMAVAVVGIFPVLVAYPFFQKYFAAGLMAGSVKG